MHLLPSPANLRASYLPPVVASALLAAGGWANVCAQESDQTQPVLELRQVLEDRDWDSVPDRIGDTVAVSGVATQRGREARAGWYYVVIEDGTAGIRLLTQNEALARAVREGNRVSATGVLTHRRGSEELQVEQLQIGVALDPPEPIDALVREANGEPLMHRLVRIRGTLRDYDPGARSAVLEDATGEITVRVVTRLVADPADVKRMVQGGAVTVTGIVGQDDRNPPYTGGYRLQPRLVDDIQWAPVVPWGWIFVALLVAGGGLTYRTMSRARLTAEVRADTLQSLNDRLKESEVRLEESERKYRSLFQDDGTGRFVLDPSGRFKTWNRACADFLGLADEEVAERTLWEVLIHVPAAWAQGGLEGGQAEISPVCAPERIGLITLMTASEEREPEVRGSIVDVTQRKELERRLVRSQKMDALGRLAGGVAHDLNNSLTTILGNTELLLGEELADDCLESLEDTKRATLRSARLTRQLLTMTRRNTSKLEPVDINAVILDMTSSIRRMVGPKIEVVVLMDDLDRHAHSDVSRVEQVVLNLVLNAKEAMPDGGILEISTYSEESWVVLTVSDNGIGMTEEEKAQIFEPFYSTKTDGSGLGLATIYGIVDSGGGRIEVESELGSGSRFSLYFPTTDDPAPAVDARPVEEDDGPIGASVLVVDDEAAIRSLSGRVLEAAGCRVVQAENGEKALRLLESDPLSFDLILTDMVMPIMDGGELAGEVERSESKIPIVFMSGFVKEEGSLQDVHTEGEYFLEKPFLPQELLAVVRSAVAGTAPR